MKFIRNKAFAAIIMAAMLVLTACGGTAEKAGSTADASTAQAQDAANAQSNVFRVGMECAYPPFNWTQLDDANGGVPLGDGTYAGGYDVAIAVRLAELMNKELEIVKIDWDGLPPSLTSGKIDAVIAGMTNTEERRATLDFTDNYYTSDLVIVVKKDGPFAAATSLADFKGAKITGQMGTLHYDVISQIEGVDQQQAMKDFPTMIAALSSGMIDGYVSERPGALAATTANPSLSFVAFEPDKGFDYSGEDVSVAIALKKGNEELRDKLNEALAQISEDERQQMMTDAIKNQPLAE